MVHGQPRTCHETELIWTFAPGSLISSIYAFKVEVIIGQKQSILDRHPLSQLCRAITSDWMEVEK